MTRKIARYDITVPGTAIGSFEVIAAGSSIPAAHADQVKEWEARGLVGDSVAVEGGVEMPPTAATGFREVTQEELDAETEAAEQRAAERSAAFRKGQEAQDKALSEQVKAQVKDAGGDADTEAAALARMEAERGSSAALSSQPAGLTEQEKEAGEEAKAKRDEVQAEQEQAETKPAAKTPAKPAAKK